MVEITDDERKNGWTEEALKKYLKEREIAQAGVVMFHPDHRKRQKPRFANNLYRPLHWRHS